MLIFVIALHLLATQTLYILEPNQEPAWKYQVESLTNEVKKLRKEIIDLEHKTIDAKNSPDEAADYERKIEKLEVRIDDLIKQKDLLLETR